jgi:hypothetical protein
VSDEGHIFDDDRILPLGGWKGRWRIRSPVHWRRLERLSADGKADHPLRTDTFLLSVRGGDRRGPVERFQV